MDRVDRDVTERKILVEIAIRGDVATAAFQTNLAANRTPSPDGADVNGRTENLAVRTGFEARRRPSAACLLVDGRLFRLLACQLEGNLFKIKDAAGASSTTPLIEENS